MDAGYNNIGQLGDGTTTSRSKPVSVLGGAAGNAVFWQISVGYYHTCSLNTTGHAFCWGEWPAAVLAVLGQLAPSANGTLAHQRILGRPAGDNSDGQLGDGTAVKSGTPVSVSGGIKFKAISAGWSHTCGLDAAGHAWCWGELWLRRSPRLWCMWHS